MSGEQKLKEGDMLIQTVESTNAHELLFFTNKAQVYKARTIDFAETKASVLGDYVPSKLDMEPAETTLFMGVTEDYKGYFIFVFENGKVAKVSVSSYQTKTNRKKLIKAYCEKFPISHILQIEEDCDILLKSTNGKALLFNTANVPLKAAKDNGGISVMTQKRGQKICSATLHKKGSINNEYRYRAKNLPAAGSKLSEDSTDSQVEMEL